MTKKNVYFQEKIFQAHSRDMISIDIYQKKIQPLNAIIFIQRIGMITDEIEIISTCKREEN